MTQDRAALAFSTVCAAVLGGMVLVLALPLADGTTRLFANCANLALVAWVAIAVGAARARRVGAPIWRTWALLSAGVLSWGAGQLVWAWYEEVLGQEAPFPSLADVGYLGLPLLAVPALLLLPSGPQLIGSRVRALLDGCLVATSAFVISWTTVLGTVYRAKASTTAELVVGLAYPLADLVLGILVLLALSRAPARSRTSFTLLGLGFTVLVVGDSAFLVGIYDGWYVTGTPLDLTWSTAFALMGLAALVHRPAPVHEALAAPRRSRGLLPYVALTPALLLVLLPSLFGDVPDRVEIITSIILLGLLMVRQFLGVQENHALMVAVARSESQLRHQAFHDSLTGLANRALFTERVRHAVDLARRDLRPLAVLYIDLDDFKLVNDCFGHAEGDRLLVAVAERLRAASGPADTVARLGGDEFALLLEDVAEDVRHTADRVASAMSAPFYLAEQSIPVSASVGAAVLQGPDCLDADADALLRDADSAMYVAKHDGKARWAVFEPRMRHTAADDLVLRSELAADIEAGRLEVVFQPVVDVATRRTTGIEALARWTSPTRGSVGPDVFVPIAESMGLMPPLGRLVLRATVAEGRRWHAIDPMLSLHVNVSPTELTGPQYADALLDVLLEHGVSPHRLVLEVTESVLAADQAQAVATLKLLRLSGVRVAVDDFGTGWSSLAQLRRLPVDVVKVDRSFVAELAVDDQAAAVVDAVLRLARALELDIVAEGVETEEQLAALAELGCGTAQGYLLGRPGRASEIVVLPPPPTQRPAPTAPGGSGRARRA